MYQQWVCVGGEPVEYSALPYISVEYSTPHVSNNTNKNSNANVDLDNHNSNSKANADLNNHYHNSQANADLTNLSNPYSTWCHTGGLLRYDASVGSSMHIPLTHGQVLKKDQSLRLVATRLPINGNRY